ncbi:MAG TPA: tetratricopeptide repeat protein, partial [Roseiflexaceae bacterium]|nr:tetratricopeptide repeat protein [Roseiflexaceae bacterium]
ALRHNLPAQTTPFIGREIELTELAQLLAVPNIRLVTILGPGGMGKTRLAIALAEQLAAAERYPDGVCFVSLAAVEAMEHLVPALAEALDFPLDTGKQQTRSPRQQVSDYLSEKQLLLILDNLEQLIGGADAVGDVAELVAELLGDAPRVAILATSRERLKLRQEHAYLLGGLDIPGAESPSNSGAVALFVQRARLLRSDFAPEANDLAVVAQICRLVEGMPLAIELAAGWVDTLALDTIAAEIEGGLDLLTTELRDVPTRHRSMRAVFEASWRRLGSAERAVLARLAVFRGGGTRRAVQAVAEATLPRLHALVGAALLHYDAGRDRYTIHELLRQYAEEKLAADSEDAAATRDRHAAYFSGLLRDLRTDLQGTRQLEALAAIQADGENVRTAWEWAAGQRNIVRIDQALESLGYFYEWQGRAEEGAAAYRLAAAALERASTSDEQRVRAQLLAWQSRCAYLLGDSAAAGALLAQSQELLDDPDLAEVDTRAARAFVLLQVGRLTKDYDYPAACTAYEQSQALFRALGDRRGEAAALFGLGAATQDLIGDYDRAQPYLQDSLAIRRALDDRLGMIETLAFVSQNARYRGQVAESEQLARESYVLSTTLDNQRAKALAADDLGMAMNWSGSYAEAHRLLEEAIAIYANLGDRGALVTSYLRRGIAEIYLGRYADARTTFTRNLELARELGSASAVGTGLVGLMFVALAEHAYTEVRALLIEAVPLYIGAGEHFFLSTTYAFGALAERGASNRAQARRHAVTALRMVLKIRIWFTMLYSLWPIALLLADDGDLERAAELYALTERVYAPRNDAWSHDIARGELAEIAAALPVDVAAAAQARGQALDLWATARELLAELEAAGWGDAD